MLLQRLKTAIPLILVVILAFFLPGWPGKACFLLLASFALVTGIQEMLTLCEGRDWRPDLKCLASAFGLALLALTAVTYWNPASPRLTASQFHGAEILLCLVFLLGAFVFAFRDQPDQTSVHGLMSVLASGLYLSLPLNYLPKVYFQWENGSWLIAFLVAVTKTADIGAYFVGTATAKLPGGNHKLAKVVSPKKSWEGLLGGLVFSTLTAWLFWHFAAAHLQGLTFRRALALGILSPFVGLLGDLAESYLKRAANAKDSGTLPGLGGILDTLDSLIPMIPLLYALLCLA
jgi:phosphatidate cytidylyltransferase